MPKQNRLINRSLPEIRHEDKGMREVIKEEEGIDDDVKDEQWTGKDN